MANINNNRKISTKNQNQYNKSSTNPESFSRKNSYNYDGYYKNDDNVGFSESEDYDGRDSLSNGANKNRRITLSKSNTNVNQPLNNLGKGSFLYQNANTIADFEARRPSFLDENFTHKVFFN